MKQKTESYLLLHIYVFMCFLCTVFLPGLAPSANGTTNVSYMANQAVKQQLQQALASMFQRQCWVSVRLSSPAPELGTVSIS